MKTNIKDYREIPYNFTSADDKLIIKLLFGSEVWDDLEELRSQRITGRSARLVMRFMGDLFILRRNPFLYQELIDSSPRRQQFFKTAETVSRSFFSILRTRAVMEGLELFFINCFRVQPSFSFKY
jgi:hypothetical protein